MPSNSIKKIVADINNVEADGGGIWLPNIQRHFVWSEDQIEMLFDSILRQYPLSSMLFWKTREPIKHRKFIDQYHEKYDLTGLYQQSSKKIKRLALDGQQRLQSFYIGLKGTVDGKLLYFNLLSGDTKSPDEIAYEFSFKKEAKAIWPWVPVREIVYTKKLPDEILQEIISDGDLEIEDEDKHTALRNISLAKREIESSENVIFQEIDGTDEDELYTFDDVVEIFIRANSGGTKLSKSDLMFTLLTSHWETADIEMEGFLEEINDNDRFSFSRDFVLKTAMSLLDKGSKYDVDKLREEKTRKEISDNWEKITDSIRFVKDQLAEKTFIRSDKALISYNALIPLIYFYYHFPDKWKQITPYRDYLLRTLLTGSFSGSPDGVIDGITSKISNDKAFNKNEIFKIIERRGRSLNVSWDKLLYEWGYGSKQIHLLFNLWYTTEYRPAFKGHQPQIDHIFPQSLLKSVKETNPETGRPIQQYNSWDINQLGNCMLLTAKENGAGDKSDTPPNEWFKDKSDDFFDLHCIPKKKSLWKLENYEKFIEARGELICAKFEELLENEEE